MDPVTISILAGLVIQGIGMLNADQAARWSKQGWHGLSGEDKMQVVKKTLEIAFQNARKEKTSAKDIFWNIIRSNIYRENEKNYNTFINLNPWIVSNSEYVPAFENKYNLKFNEIPTVENPFEKIKNNKWIAIGISSLIVLIIIAIILRT